jgi:hypothetical protein
MIMNALNLLKVDAWISAPDTANILFRRQAETAGTETNN